MLAGRSRSLSWGAICAMAQDSLTPSDFRANDSPDGAMTISLVRLHSCIAFPIETSESTMLATSTIHRAWCQLSH